MRNSSFLWIILGIMIILDVYVYQAIKFVAPTASPKARMAIIISYWFVSAVALLFLLLLPYINFNDLPKGLRTYAFSLIVALFFSKLVASIFLAIDDLRRASMWLIGKLFSNPNVKISQSAEGITRSAFLSWLALGLGTTLFGSFVYGFGNKYRYQVKRLKLNFDNLPDAFRGTRIVHISDIHSGSFLDKAAVQKGVEKIMKEKPDMILFTGDLVNDHAEEMKDYIDVFNQLRAPLGVYSTLGNHDYGEYAIPRDFDFDKRRERVAENVTKMKQVHTDLGWKLLMNEHVLLEKDGGAIAVMGVENWSGKGNFSRYGKLDKAHPGANGAPFKILMSHDPSHWNGEVTQKYGDIDLTLSGHTHGMQFGVEVPGFRWSPVQYMYKQWAGLYEQGRQKLYVNRGFGFIGYPGRVGILPEITVIELS